MMTNVKIKILKPIIQDTFSLKNELFCPIILTYKTYKISLKTKNYQPNC